MSFLGENARSNDSLYSLSAASSQIWIPKVEQLEAISQGLLTLKFKQSDLMFLLDKIKAKYPAAILPRRSFTGDNLDPGLFAL